MKKRVLNYSQEARKTSFLEALPGMLARHVSLRVPPTNSSKRYFPSLHHVKGIISTVSKKWIWFVVGAVVSVLVIISARFLLMPEKRATHFHANFGIFVNGKRVDLADKKYMEDVAGCRPDYLPMQPKERTHMHNGEDMVVHVHDDGVTWGHFFSNIGFSFGDSYLVVENEKFYRGSQSLKFVLNNEAIENPWNKLINSEDRLLISFGSESLERVMKDQWVVVPTSAHEKNDHPDPGSCSGVIENTFWDKVKRAVWY